MNNQNENYPNTVNRNGQSDSFKMNSEHSFFSKEELDYFYKDHANVILTKKDGMPFLNYPVAKKIFEDVVGQNYSIETLSKDFFENTGVYLVHAKFTLTRGDKTIVREVFGSNETIIKKSTGEVTNFQNIHKSAMKDCIKKFLIDQMGIGALQYASLKSAYEQRKSEGWNNSNFNNSGNNITGNGANNNPNNGGAQQYTQNYSNVQPALVCSECNVPIAQTVFDFSLSNHPQRRPLCRNCQIKLR